MANFQLRLRRQAAATPIVIALSALPFLLPASLPAQPSDLAVRKLSPAGLAASDVPMNSGWTPEISPDGKWIAFWFDGDTDEVYDVYVASRFGGAPRRVSALRPPGSLALNLTQLEISADSRWVVFYLDQETPGLARVWSVPIDGGPGDAVELSTALPAAWRANSFQIAAAGDTVVFTSYDDETDTSELWWAPIDGSAAAEKLHGALPVGADGVDAIQIVGDHVVVEGDFGVAGRKELWSAPTDGGEPLQRLNGAIVAGGSVLGYSVSPDRETLVYRATQRFVGVVELWSVPVAGPFSAVERLSPTLPANGDVGSIVQFTQNSSRVLFLADAGAEDDQMELWSAPIAGPAGETVKLSKPLVAGGDVMSFSAIDGPELVATYIADDAVDEQLQMYVVPLAGPAGDSVRVHGDLPAGGDIALGAPIPRAGEPLLLLGGDARVDQEYDLFIQTVDAAGPPHPIFADVPSNAGFQGGCGGAFAPDFSYFFACADLRAQGRIELWRMPVDMVSTATLLSSSVSNLAGDVTRVILSPDGRYVAYRADEQLDERFDLYRVRADGSAPPDRVHAEPLGTSDVPANLSFEFTPDGAGLVYGADHETDDKVELWISDAMIFRADFEPGDLREWSLTQP